MNTTDVADKLALRDVQERVLGAPVIANGSRDWPMWVFAAAKQIGDYAQLAQGWDGYGAAPTDKGAAGRAISLLGFLSEKALEAKVLIKEPSVGPTGRRSILIEWSDDKKYLSVEVLPDDQPLEFYLEQHGKQTEESASSATDLWAKVRTFFEK